MNIPNLDANGAKISELADALKMLSNHSWASMVGESADDSKDWHEARETVARAIYDLYHSAMTVTALPEEGDRPISLTVRSIYFMNILVDTFLLMEISHTDWGDVMAAIDHRLKELEKVANGQTLATNKFRFTGIQVTDTKKPYIKMEGDQT